MKRTINIVRSYMICSRVAIKVSILKNCFCFKRYSWREVFIEQRSYTFMFSIASHHLHLIVTSNFQIQSKTKRCNGNRATCSCSCTMKSGGDIFMINHCDTHRTQFLSDDNKALYVYRITTNKYEVST